MSNSELSFVEKMARDGESCVLSCILNVGSDLLNVILFMHMEKAYFRRVCVCSKTEFFQVSSTVQSYIYLEWTFHERMRWVWGSVDQYVTKSETSDITWLEDALQDMEKYAGLFKPMPPRYLAPAVLAESTPN